VSLYGVGALVVDALLGLLTRRTHRHLERIPARGPVVVVANHISLADPLVVACALRRARRRATFLTMVEAFSWPGVGWLLRRTEQIPVDRGLSGRRAEALQPALDALRAGHCVALYPEGRITTDPGYRMLPTGRTGAVRLAIAAGCPVLPMAQWGAQELFSREHTSSLTRRPRFRGRWGSERTPRRPRITVLVGEPITAAELWAAGGVDQPPLEGHQPPEPDPAVLRAATAEVMSRLRALRAEIVPDEA